MSLSFLILQAVNASVNDFSMKLNYSEPKIYTGGVNIDNWSKLTSKQKKQALDKRWFVYYSFRNPETGRLKKQPFVQGGANRFKTKRERYAVLRKLRDTLSKMLSMGVNPYEDNTELENQLIDKPNKTKQKREQQQKHGQQPTPSLPQQTAEPKTKQKESNPIETEMTISEAIEFGLSLKQRMMSEISYIQYKSRINLFKKWLEEKLDINQPISSVSKKIVQAYLNDVLLRTSARNRNNSRTDIASLYQLFEENEIVRSNFVKAISKLKTKPKRNKTYTEKQNKDLFNYIKTNDPVLLLLIKFVGYNFLRPIEVCRLRIKDIDLDSKQLRVKAKNQPVKTKIIPDILFKDLPDLSKKPRDNFLLARFSVGEEWSAKESSRRDEFSKRFKKVKDHFGLGAEYGLYSFRHTFITHLYRKLRKENSPFETKSKLMLITGHSTMAALEKYLRDIDAELPEDYSDLFE